jgi:hypothetical protein
MRRNARVAAISVLFIVLVAGAELALAPPQPHRPPGLAGTNSTTTASMRSPASGPVAPPPLNRVGVPLTGDECLGLGGIMLPETACKSSWTCETGDPDGTVHHACITK